MNGYNDVGEIYQQFREPLKKFITKKISDENSAEDILHDVFIKIHDRIGTLKEKDRLESWIYTVARNAVIDFYRKTRGQTEVPDDIPFEPEVIRDVSDRLARTVRLMIDKLPDMYKEALLLADFDKIKHHDIARRLGISVPGVKSRVQRARKMLKELLLPVVILNSTATVLFLIIIRKTARAVVKAIPRKPNRVNSMIRLDLASLMLRTNS